MMPARLHDTLERDGFNVHIYTSDQMILGTHLGSYVLGPGVRIVLRDKDDFPVDQMSFPAPTHVVYEPNTKNKIGTLGAYRDVWDDITDEWLEPRI